MSFNPTRLARNASATVVASIAGYASYWHQVEVAAGAGERAELAHVIPFSVDGLLIVTSIAMVDARQQGRHPHWMTRVGFALGIVASVGANVAAAQPTLLGRLVAAWPAVALLLTVESLSHKGRALDEPTAEMAEVPVSPAVVPQAPEAAISAESKRAPYGPRGDEYSKRHARRMRSGR